jgi:hypothetical protein
MKKGDEQLKKIDDDKISFFDSAEVKSPSEKTSSAKNIKNKNIFNQETPDLSVSKTSKEIVNDPVKKNTEINIDAKKTWFSSDILSTNLIKGESTIVYRWNKYLLILFGNIFAVIFLVALVYGFLLYWEKVGKEINAKLDLSANNLKTQIDSLKKEVEAVNVFNEKIKLANGLLDKHIYWEDFFQFLEANILTDVYLVDSFAGDTGGKYVFRAYTKDLKTMLDQVNFLRQEALKDRILSAQIANISAGDETDNIGGGNKVAGPYKVSFDLIIKINQDIFYKQKK